MNLSLIDYALATNTSLTPTANCLYQYIMAANGLFIRAENRTFRIVSQIAKVPIAGLARVENEFKFHLPRVPLALTEQLLDRCQRYYPHEVYLQLTSDGVLWKLKQPQQITSGSSVQWQGGDSCDIELHSHPHHQAKFSSIDDRDERGLCLYAVIGFPTKDAEILLRVGIYGQWFTYLPARTVFELPEHLRDRFNWEEFHACDTANYTSTIFPR